MIGLYIALGVFAALVALFAVVIVRTLKFVPTEQKREAPAPVRYNGDKVVSYLSKLIKC